MKKLLAAALLATLALGLGSDARAAGNSTYLGGKVLAWATGTAMPASPGTLCVALFNGDPTDAGAGGTEVSATVRTAGRVCGVTWTITGKAMANSAPVNFGPAAAGATFTHFAVFDAATGGNELISGPITGGGTTVSAGTTVSFAAGALTWAE